MNDTQKYLNKILTGIAQKNIPGIETLELRGRDSLDFHDVSVGCLRRALEDAFIAGMTSRFELGKTNHHFCYWRDECNVSYVNGWDDCLKDISAICDELESL